MSGGKGKKVINAKQLIFKNILKYETNYLKIKSTDPVAKPKITDVKPTVIPAKWPSFLQVLNLIKIRS